MKNIIITGTSRGIGFELVKLFSAAGHRVLALSRNTVPVLELNLNNCESISCDLTVALDIEKAQDFIHNQWGHVDVVIHNAGLLVNAPFSEINLLDFKRVYDVNVFGIAALTQMVLPFMKKNGHIITISSMGGVQGSVKFPGLSAYSSSKGAVLTLMEVLAEEYKETGPSFNALALGAVQTEMLAEAFPGYEAPLSATEMASYIYDFALKGQKLFNGKILQVSNSTP